MSKVVDRIQAAKPCPRCGPESARLDAAQVLKGEAEQPLMAHAVESAAWQSFNEAPRAGIPRGTSSWGDSCAGTVPEAYRPIGGGTGASR